MTSPTVPPRAPRHRLPIAPSYLESLRAEVVRIGVVKVAAAAKVHRHTLWRSLAGGEGRHPTVEAIELVRKALVKLGAEPVPPPVVAVRGRAHAAWIALADRLDTATLEAVAKAPAAVLKAARAKNRRR